MVVHSDGKSLLGCFLTDDVFIKGGLDFMRCRQVFQLKVRRFFRLFLFHDVLRYGNTFVANVDARAGNELLYFTLGPAAETATRFIIPIVHLVFLLSYFVSSGSGRVRISSIRP